MTVIGSMACILGVVAAIWIVALCLGLCYEAATTEGEDEQCDLLTGGDGEAEAVHRCWAQLMFYWAEGSSLVLDGVVVAVGSDHVMTPVGTPFSLRITKPGHDLPRTVLRLMCLAGGGDKVLLHIRDVDDVH